MKTPREFLLGRHRAVEPKLDRMRREVVADTEVGLDRRASRCLISTVAPSSLREFLLSLRWHVAAMSAVWLVAVLLNMDYSRTSALAVVKQNAPSPNQVLVALRENRRQLSELIQTPAAEVIPVPRTIVPRRRSELQSPTEMA